MYGVLLLSNGAAKAGEPAISPAAPIAAIFAISIPVSPLVVVHQRV
ncbi:hypothetical protein BN135_780 [Cronobacter muytjensii 530]